MNLWPEGMISFRPEGLKNPKGAEQSASFFLSTLFFTVFHCFSLFFTVFHCFSLFFTVFHSLS